MSLKHNGYIFYEIIISLMILLLISSSLLSITNNFSLRVENQKLTFKMKQYLTINIILLENNEELLIDDRYTLTIENDKICIIWSDLYGHKQKICEKVWL